MFAQEDGAVVMKLEKLKDVIVNKESKVIIVLPTFRFLAKLQIFWKQGTLPGWIYDFRSFLLFIHMFQIAAIECGAKQGEVDKTTTEYGLVTTLGQASFVGASGSGLLLGMGLLGRSYGYAIDNLHSIGTVLGFWLFNKFNFSQLKL